MNEKHPPVFVDEKHPSALKCSALMGGENGVPFPLRGWLCREVLWGFLFLVVQQLLVASSIWALAQAVLAVGTPSKFIVWILLYAGFLVAPYAPGVAACYFFDLWPAKVYRRVHSFALKKMKPSPLTFTDKKLGDRRAALFGGTSQVILSEVTRYAYDFFASFLNSLFSILVVGAVLNWYVAASYTGSILLCALYTKWKREASAQSGHMSEEMRVRTVGVASLVWPNLIIGNLLNRESWRKALESAHTSYRGAIKRESVIRHRANFIISVLSVVPSVVVVVVTACLNVNNQDYLLVLLATAPRVFQLLINLAYVVFLVFDASRIFSKVRFFSDISTLPAPPTPRIQWEKIHVDDGEKNFPRLESCDLLKLNLANPSRYTLRGENGAGKTTLLLRLKERYGGRAFYLPPQSGLVFPQDDCESSTGERKLFELSQIEKSDRCEILLLDEWDANLDPSRVREINELIRRLAESRVVVEVRHKE